MDSKRGDLCKLVAGFSECSILLHTVVNKKAGRSRQTPLATYDFTGRVDWIRTSDPLTPRAKSLMNVNRQQRTLLPQIVLFNWSFAYFHQHQATTAPVM